jgi:hypothetical protein
MTEAILELPPDLDGVADQWRAHIEKNIKITMTIDVSKHVDGSTSTYVAAMDFMGDEVVRHTMYYAGQSGQPRTRASLHKSELKNCKTTTRIGKSQLYSRKYMTDVNAINIKFEVHEGGFTLEAAKNAEKALSAELERLHGSEAVLTRPRGKKIKAQ